MRNKMVLLAIVMIASVANVWSQTASTEEVYGTRWGIKGGINVATINFENGNNSISMESVAGAVAGVTLEHPFTPKWFFHSGLELSMKGFEISLGGSKVTSTAIYMLLPAAVGYKFDIGKGWKIEPRLGLFLAYGIAGNTSASVSGGSGSVSTFGEKILTPFDGGAMFGCFFDNNKIVIGVHGEQGLTETNSDNFKVTGAKAHSNNVSITVGYLF